MSFNSIFKPENTLGKRLLLPIFAIGIILRLYKWNGYSFWFDEVNCLMISRGKLFVSLQSTVAIFKPPLFRFLAYFWAYIGQDEFRLRLLPFIFGILSILFTYKVAKIMFDEKTGLIASFLISLSPFHIYYSQEFTHYTLTVFLALCSIYYLVQSLEKNNIYSWLKFIFFTSLSLYANYISLLFLIAENLFFFFSYTKYKKLIKGWLLSQSAILLLYSPWLTKMSIQFSILRLDYYRPYVDWIPEGSLAYILQALKIFNAGYNANFIIQSLVLLLFFPLLLIGIFSSFKKDITKTRLLVFWIFIPMLLAIIFSRIAHSFSYRNFIFALPAYYILIALGIMKIKKYIYIPVIFYIILSGASLFNYYRNIFPYPEKFFRPGVHAKKDNRGATKYIISNFKKGDIIMHTCRSTVLPYVYYLIIFNYNNIIYPRDFIYSLVDLSINKEYLAHYDWESHFLVDREYKIAGFIKADNKRIWLIFSAWEPQQLALAPENKVKRWFDNNLKVIDYKKFTGIDVYLYEKLNN